MTLSCSLATSTRSHAFCNDGRQSHPARPDLGSICMFRAIPVQAIRRTAVIDHGRRRRHSYLEKPSHIVPHIIGEGLHRAVCLYLAAHRDIFA